MSSKDDLLAQAVENDANYNRRSLIKSNDAIDETFGFARYTGKKKKKGFLINIQPSELVDANEGIVSVVDLFFISDTDERFKISYPFRPYFYIATLGGFDNVRNVASKLREDYKEKIQTEIMDKEDLDLKDHPLGLKKTYIKLSFTSTVEMMKIRKDLMPLVRKNTDYLARNLGGEGGNSGTSDAQLDGDILNQIVDIREYDVPFHMRVSIDEKIFVGLWYDVNLVEKQSEARGFFEKPVIKPAGSETTPAKPRCFAFKIETTKIFPNQKKKPHQIMMISVMVDGRGFLIINREIVSKDIDAFEYTPKAEYKGEFTVWNEKDETALIRKFFDHFLQVRPDIVVTFNGDFFDWPFVEARAKIRGFNMEKEIGFSKDSADEYKSRNCIHMDAFQWVKRDSYLPVGSQNLKAVTKAKLRYDPVEVEPELMCKMAREQPQQLANYSASNAVSTYYLYMNYVHQFIFALCTIIPLGADDVLRKGSGTLCEALLMVEAFRSNIVFPNKYTGPEETDFSQDGHRVESETYVGEHVEAREAGVFRADIPARFRLSVDALEQLKSEIPKTLRKELAREFEVSLDQVENFEQKCAEVEEAFDGLIAVPTRLENPRIYHLDVSAMYPNIILYQLPRKRMEGFYVKSLKTFRDRRYGYKDKWKKAKERFDQVQAENDLATSKLEMVLYESLQLAHKCILNSFYGYVMRKGSRWYSMEMAGIVCHTGANIIKEARKLVDGIGKPLELHADGIWFVIPASFPENVTFKLKNHKRNHVTVSYSGAILDISINETVEGVFQNNRNLEEESSENLIYSVVDGPYQCMVLPASKEEGKKLKESYAVLNLDGSLAEMKGFELKRRGELNIIKHFQSHVFKTFLNGKTLEETYKAVAGDANRRLDILHSHGEEISNQELFDLMSENRSMSRKLEDYGSQKSTSITTAKRLAEFLREDMIKDASLACMFIISRHPIGAPVTERAIPVAIFKADSKVKSHYIRKWTKHQDYNENTDIRVILDWDYYIERFGSCIQKIITIPAALQGVVNPVPRVPHPDWLQMKIQKMSLENEKRRRIPDVRVNSDDVIAEEGPEEVLAKLNKSNNSNDPDEEESQEDRAWQGHCLQPI